jgi:hypothetical protein
LQLSQDCTATRIMRGRDVANLFKQPLIDAGELLPQRSDKLMLLSGKLIHANAHCLDLLDQSAHCCSSCQLASDAGLESKGVEHGEATFNLDR